MSDIPAGRITAFRENVGTMLRPRGRVFYGWWMVAASAGIQAVIAVLFNQAFGAYAAVLRDDFGWSRGALSGAFSLARFESGILGPIQGWMIDRFGPRAVMIAGLSMFAGGLMIFSQINSLLQFYIVFFFMAVGSSLGGFLAITVALVNWFNRHRAKALSLSQIGFSAGGLLVPITVASIEFFGWRETAFGSGVAVLALGLPLAMMIRHRPEAYGETPDGIPFTPRQAAAEAEAAKPHWAVAADGSEDFTAREALRTRSFWLISLGHASALLIVSAVMVHLVLHLNENLGYSLTAASLFVALMTAMQMTGQIMGGILGDRFNKRAIVIACMAAHAIGLISLAFATNTLMVIAFAILHGLAWGTRGPLMQAIRADYFGSSNFGAIMGWSSMIVMIGTTSGPLVAGFLADRTGNYEVGFTVLAIAAAMGSIFFMLATKPTPPDRGAGVPVAATEPTAPIEAVPAGDSASA
ncbi:MAG: MFS transporter [Dehalococcoidia bacterium]